MVDENQNRNLDQPGWLASTLRWIGYLTLIIGAVAGLLAAIGKLGDTLEPACKAIASLPWCAPPPPPAPRPIPQLASTSTGWMGGGPNQKEFCEPQMKVYQSQFPDFDIAWLGSEESDKDALGHARYKYHCGFTATPKASK